MFTMFRDSFKRESERPSLILNECRKIQCSCGQMLEREGSETDLNSVAAHFNSPAVVLTHILRVLSFADTCMESIQKVDVRLTELTKVHEELQSNFKHLLDRMAPFEQQYYAERVSKDNDKIEELRTKMHQLEEKMNTTPSHDDESSDLGQSTLNSSHIGEIYRL